MDLKELMTGIGVVIDDALDGAAAGGEDEVAGDDPIFEIVRQLEDEWNLPILARSSMPPDEMWPGLLRASSFVLLDWCLWQVGAAELERAGIERNVRFLLEAKDYFVPVFIFTNEEPEDVTTELPEEIYSEESPQSSFVFIRKKRSLLSGGSLDFEAIEQWMRDNASIYALKMWERSFYGAKRELFSSMYRRTPDWPRVFWKAYREDGVDPSSSLTHLINDSLRGRMWTRAFEAEILGEYKSGVPGEDLRALIGETSVRRQEALRNDEIACGDMFRDQQGKYRLNLRPDCDCVPRDGTGADEVELYLVEGKAMAEDAERNRYRNGHFEERIWESIAFCVDEGRSVRFDFRKFNVAAFSEWRDQRIGRLLHPYVTRVQQRFGLYLQRQGLPRIPGEAIPAPLPEPGKIEP